MMGAFSSSGCLAAAVWCGGGKILRLCEEIVR